MLVKELIQILQNCNPDAVVKIPVKTFTQRFPVDYCDPFIMDAHPHTTELRIFAALREGIYTVDRKAK